MNATTLRRVAPYLIILFAFAVRVFAIDSTLVDGDHANPHGMSLLMVSQLARGEFTQLLLFSDDASTGIPNGPIVNYVLALVSLFDKSLFTAIALGLMANVLVTACVYTLGRRFFGQTAGLVAAMLAASSNWAVYLTRGTWHPAYVEVSVVVTATLLTIGVQQPKGRALVAGFIGAFATAAHYFGAMVMPVQAAIATVAAGAWQPRLRKAWLTGFGISIAGLMAFVLTMMLTGRLSLNTVTGLNLFRNEHGIATEGDLVARDITPTNRDPIGHFLRLATNRDYADSWTNPQFQGYAVREPLTQALALVVSALVLLGVARMVWHWRRPANRFLLMWAALPILALLILIALKRDFSAPIYYLLLATPVQYIAGGYGLAGVLDTLRATPKFAFTGALCGLMGLMSAWNASAAAESIYKQPYVIYDFMPLKWSMRLSQLWKQECARVNGTNMWWDLSLLESPDRWRRNGTRFDDKSSIWSVAPQGGTCALKQNGTPLPHSDLLPLQVDDGSIIRTFRSQPLAFTPEPTLTVNLGWTLLHFDTPLSAAAGSTITVQHAWRVDTLPGEPFADWYYAPFIKVVAANGTVVRDINGAIALPGWQWQAGDVQLSTVEIALPADLAPGQYTIESSLFDPNQKKNAVYFDAARPGEPILVLRRTITVQ